MLPRIPNILCKHTGNRALFFIACVLVSYVSSACEEDLCRNDHRTCQMGTYEKHHFPQNSMKHATLKRRCQKKHDASERIVKSIVHLHDIRTKRNDPQSLMTLEWLIGPLKYLNVAFDQQQTTLNVLAMLPRTVQNAR